MRTEGETVHVNETEASAGSKEGVVRWVLLVGVVLAILLLSIIWISGSATKNGPVADQSVSNKIHAEKAQNEATAVTTAPTATTDGEVTHQNGLTVEKNNATPQ